MAGWLIWVLGYVSGGVAGVSLLLGVQARRRRARFREAPRPELPHPAAAGPPEPSAAALAALDRVEPGGGIVQMSGPEGELGSAVVSAPFPGSGDLSGAVFCHVEFVGGGPFDGKKVDVPVPPAVAEFAMHEWDINAAKLDDGEAA